MKTPRHSITPGDFDECDECGKDYPSGSRDHWHLIDGQQVCAKCAAKIVAEKEKKP